MRLRYLAFILFLLSSAGCRYFRSDASIQVHAIDGSGSPLVDANVIIDKTLVGKTDHQGLFRTSLELATGEPILIEVNKPSDKIFYAPYFETIQVQRADANVFKLKATLYGVNKEAEEAEVAAAPAPSVDEAAPEATSETPEVEESSDTTLSVASSDVAAEPTVATPAIPSKILTFYVGSGSDLVNGASVFYGDSLHKQWSQGCVTNNKGRCSISIPENQDSLSLLVRAKGFQSQNRQVSLDEGDKIRFDIKKGRALEFFALTSVGREGIEGIKVSTKGRELCTTDAFGSCMISPDKVNDGDEIVMESKDWLPSKLSQTLTAGPQLFLQNYQPLKPQTLRIAVLPLTRYELEGSTLREWEQPISNLSEVFSREGVNIVSKDDLESTLLAQNKTLQDLSFQGWNQIPLDYIVRSTLVNSKQPKLTVSAIRSDGAVAAAVARDLGSKPSAKQVESATFDLLQKLPREGSIIEKVGDDYRINLGNRQGVQKGETLQVQGQIRRANSESFAFGDIAEAIVTEVGQERSRVHVIDQKAQGKIDVGNRIILLRQINSEGRTTTLTVKSKSDVLAQAEIYLGNRWLGATGKDGRVQVNELPAQGEIMVLRVGYTPKIMGTTQLTTATIELEHDNIPIHVESNPGSALVRMNDRELGRTPLDISIPFPGRIVKLEVGGVDGYRDSKRSVQLSDAGLSLTGLSAVVLEKDPRQSAEKAIKENRFEDAVAILESIGPDDPSYLISQHQLGEIFLNRLFDPLKAAEAFHRVTSKVQYTDKRFIGTFINEAVALFQAGEKSAAADRNLAISYWRQAGNILEQTEEQLRYVPADQYNQAVHTLSYYRALSSHKIWVLTQNPDDKALASKQWKDYIQGTALALPQDKHFSWVKKAEAYFQELQGESHARSDGKKSGTEM